MKKISSPLDWRRSSTSCAIFLIAAWQASVLLGQSMPDTSAQSTGPSMPSMLSTQGNGDSTSSSTNPSSGFEIIEATPVPLRPNNGDQASASDQAASLDAGSTPQQAANETSNSNSGSQPNDGNTAGGTENQSLLQSDKLNLSDVIASIYRFYPEVNQARLEWNRTNGELTAAYGAFDTKLYGHSLTEPTGFYENQRAAIGVARQTWWGGYVSAGYKIGEGNFAPWYKERQTNEGGEFAVSWIQPLLQGRAIDPYRVAVFQASLARQAASPTILQTILYNAQEASQLYWSWVAAGQTLETTRQLLELAQLRNEQFEAGVKAGKFAEIDLILNQQLVAERQVKLLETEQKFRAITFKLSLFLRDNVGNPLIPMDAWQPTGFPQSQFPTGSDLQRDIADAITRRPETALLALDIRQIQQEQLLARNYMLPQLDMISEGSQDIGGPASTPDDKGQFELLVGVEASVPIQRRKALGKIQSTGAKIAQLNEKLRLQRDKIAVELQTAYNAWEIADQTLRQSEIASRAANETLTRYSFAFERGKIDLIYLNLLESKANETAIKVIEARRSWFSALAQMQAALGLDPLEQSILIDAIPKLTANDQPAAGVRKGPAPPPEILEKDWQLHTQPRP